ncbi:MAG TPA: helix-turn-helix transcriptional regulator [Gemmatimonadaceae bacterium]|nr:helix-turn-helix transcriptional regulator [Gemmatimonadaceae bacterium]
MRRQKALTKAFGAVINGERKRLGMSQERLGLRAKIHPTYISQLERGLKSPSLEVIAALAKALGRKPHELIRTAEEKTH